MGLWLMYHSFMAIAFGGDMSTFKLSGSPAVICGGILLLLLLLSIFVLVDPFSVGITTILVFAGVGLIILRLLLCMISFKLKDIRDAYED